MKYEEDYTQEDWGLVQRRETLNDKDKYRQIETVNPGFHSRKSAKWNSKNREKYNEYHRIYMREWIKKHGRPRRMRSTEIKKSLKKARYNGQRGRVTRNIYDNIMQQEQKGKIMNYLEENMNGNRKKIIMCIVGGSGTGKTLASLHLQNKFGANVICSYTTRPPRDDEEEGREHHFVDIVPPQEDLLAFTRYGAYKYYATKAQVHGPVTVYVIDEAGLLCLKNKFGDIYDIRSYYIERRRMYRIISGVSSDRMKRDNHRKELIPPGEYDEIIINDGTKTVFFETIDRIYNNLLKISEGYGWKREEHDSDIDSL